MGTQELGQEQPDAYRYQLATMAYAVCSINLQAIDGEDCPQDAEERGLGDWFLMSHSGSFVDPDLKEL